MAAIHAAGPEVDVSLLERTRDGGRKILISGGGRCNILPSRLDESRFVTDSSPHILRRIVRSWPLPEQIAFFEQELRLSLVEEAESAKLFPASHRARDVRDGLLGLAVRRGTQFFPDTRVLGINPLGSGWRIERAGASALHADAVILASGGLSVPQTGSDGAGLGFLSGLGHKLNPVYAALTPLLAAPAPFGHLSGVSLPVTMTAVSGSRRAKASGGFLFTHHGYSGPAVLDISHVAVRSQDEGGPPAIIHVRWSALGRAEWETALTADGRGTVARVIKDVLPERLATALLELAQVEAGRTLAQLRRDERNRLVDTLVRGSLPWTGHEGYKKAEVTGGGLDLSDIDSRTMESRKHPGLFVCGEALDAFGPIGGYNFLWAWATGRAAGLAAAAGVSPE
jgi:predicted Rossmann fold flavoprotein